MDQVSNLRLLGFTRKKITNLLRVCTGFLCRKKKEWINRKQLFQNNLVRHLFRDSPNMSEWMMAVALGCHEVEVQRGGIRKSTTHVNPSNQLSHGVKLPGYKVSENNILF